MRPIFFNKHKRHHEIKYHINKHKFEKKHKFDKYLKILLESNFILFYNKMYYFKVVLKDFIYFMRIFIS